MREITQDMIDGFMFLYEKSKSKNFIRNALINAYDPFICHVNMRELYRYTLGEPNGGRLYINALKQLEIANIQGIETQEVIGEKLIEELLSSYKAEQTKE